MNVLVYLEIHFRKQNKSIVLYKELQMVLRYQKFFKKSAEKHLKIYTYIQDVKEKKNLRNSRGYEIRQSKGNVFIKEMHAQVRILRLS